MFQHQTFSSKKKFGKLISVQDVCHYMLLSAVPVLFCMVLTLFIRCSSNAKEQADNEQTLQADKDSIMATIEKETKSFFARDYEGWKSTYAHEDYAFQAWSNRDGTFDASVGWEGIDNSVGKYIHDNPEPQTGSNPIVERKRITFKFYGKDACYLTWDQYNSNKDGNFRHSKEVRVMEKKSGQWKIVCVAAFWDYVNIIPANQLKDIQSLDKENRGTNKL
ncbi:hypothetical protein [Niabella aurantiaca]|uniref:hypothetical protein n=1 Tax=Niabella aurantiaca TaxID=379900 RepID=UPI0003710D2F|nr:hypothetical protein [Niabella aurantiaca]